MEPPGIVIAPDERKLVGDEKVRRRVEHRLEVEPELEVELRDAAQGARQFAERVFVAKIAVAGVDSVCERDNLRADSVQSVSFSTRDEVVENAAERVHHAGEKRCDTGGKVQIHRLPFVPELHAAFVDDVGGLGVLPHDFLTDFLEKGVARFVAATAFHPGGDAVVDSRHLVVPLLVVADGLFLCGAFLLDEDSDDGVREIAGEVDVARAGGRDCADARSNGLDVALRGRDCGLGALAKAGENRGVGGGKVPGEEIEDPRHRLAHDGLAVAGVARDDFEGALECGSNGFDAEPGSLLVAAADVGEDGGVFRLVIEKGDRLAHRVERVRVHDRPLDVGVGRALHEERDIADVGHSRGLDLCEVATGFTESGEVDDAETGHVRRGERDANDEIRDGEVRACLDDAAVWIGDERTQLSKRDAPAAFARKVTFVVSEMRLGVRQALEDIIGFLRARNIGGQFELGGPERREIRRSGNPDRAAHRGDYFAQEGLLGMEIGDGGILVRAVFDLASDGGREILVRRRNLGFLKPGDGLEERTLAHPGRAANADAERVARKARADLGGVFENAAKRFRDGTEVCGCADKIGVDLLRRRNGGERSGDFVRAGLPAGDVGVKRPQARGTGGENGIELGVDGAHDSIGSNGPKGLAIGTRPGVSGGRTLRGSVPTCKL